MLCVECKLSHIYEFVRFQKIRVRFDNGFCGYMRFNLLLLHTRSVLWICMFSQTSSLLLYHHDRVNNDVCAMCSGLRDWIVGKDSRCPYSRYRNLWIGSLVSLVCNHAVRRSLQVLPSYNFDAGNVRLYFSHFPPSLFFLLLMMTLFDIYIYTQGTDLDSYFTSQDFQNQNFPIDLIFSVRVTSSGMSPF